MKSLLGVLVLALACASASAKDIQIVVYHTNDIHGWIDAKPASFSKRPNDLVGGFPALATVVKADRRPTLLLDAGDWFQGSAEGDVSRGRALIDGFNALGYDAIEVGNHDFDFGQAQLKELVARARMPVLGANIYDGKTGERVGYLKPWIIKDVAGVKIGVFGLLTTNMPMLAFPDNIAGLRFRNEVDEARDDVAALKKAGATVIIAVTHVGYEDEKLGKFAGDQTIAREVPGIDLIVGGHTHTFIRQPLHEPTNGTLIVQAGTHLSDVGQVVLKIDPTTKKVKSSEGRLITLWLDEHPADTAVAAVLKPYEDEVQRVYDVVVATAVSALSHNCHADTESALGDWAGDCVRQDEQADVAVENGCGLRAPIPQGPIKLRGIYDVMPFDNRVVNVTLTGRELRDVLDYGVARGKGIIQVSGVSFSYDRDAPAGRRVWNIVVGGRPLDPAGSYKIATSDFLVRGGEGYAPLRRVADPQITQLLWRDALSQCARNQGLVRPPALGRMDLQRGESPKEE